jgi:hypothetical protein
MSGSAVSFAVKQEAAQSLSVDDASLRGLYRIASQEIDVRAFTDVIILIAAVAQLE